MRTLEMMIEETVRMYTLPPDAYRVILEVDERRIADVKTGQHGHMILSALPNDSFGFVVEKITPISTAEEGLNYFRVEAKPGCVPGRLVTVIHNHDYSRSPRQIIPFHILNLDLHFFCVIIFQRVDSRIVSKKEI